MLLQKRWHLKSMIHEQWDNGVMAKRPYFYPLFMVICLWQFFSFGKVWMASIIYHVQLIVVGMIAPMIMKMRTIGRGLRHISL